MIISWQRLQVLPSHSITRTRGVVATGDESWWWKQVFSKWTWWQVDSNLINKGQQLPAISEAKHPETLHSEAIADTFGIPKIRCFFVSFFGRNLFSPLMQLMTYHLRWIDDFWKDVYMYFRNAFHFLKILLVYFNTQGRLIILAMPEIHTWWFSQAATRKNCIHANAWTQQCIASPVVGKLRLSTFHLLTTPYWSLASKINLTLKSNDIEIKHLQAQVLVILVAWKR